jgi:hypothetical protein
VSSRIAILLMERTKTCCTAGSETISRPLEASYIAMILGDVGPRLELRHLGHEGCTKSGTIRLPPSSVKSPNE